ncbi:hypothetical protein ACSAZL_21920 [Methanosarcina sp. T3]
MKKRTEKIRSEKIRSEKKSDFHKPAITEAEVSTKVIKADFGFFN